MPLAYWFGVALVAFVLAGWYIIVTYNRQFYNDVVGSHNGYIQSFPTMLVAYWLQLRTMEYFSLDHPSEKAVPNVSLS